MRFASKNHLICFGNLSIFFFSNHSRILDVYLNYHMNINLLRDQGLNNTGVLHVAIFLF